MVGPGISIANVQEAIVEDNVINNCAATGSAAAVAYDSGKVQYLKSFNNQSTAGALMRAYDTSTSRPLPELTDFAQDSLMSF